MAQFAVLTVTLAVASPRFRRGAQPVRALWNLAGSATPAVGVTRPGGTALTLDGDQALFVLGTERRKKLFSIAIDGSWRAVDRFHVLAPGSAGISVKLDGSSALSGALFATLDKDPLMQAMVARRSDRWPRSGRCAA